MVSSFPASTSSWHGACLDRAGGFKAPSTINILCCPTNKGHTRTRGTTRRREGEGGSNQPSRLLTHVSSLCVTVSSPAGSDLRHLVRSAVPVCARRLVSRCVAVVLAADECVGRLLVCVSTYSMQETNTGVISCPAGQQVLTGGGACANDVDRLPGDVSRHRHAPHPPRVGACGWLTDGD